MKRGGASLTAVWRFFVRMEFETSDFGAEGSCWLGRSSGAKWPLALVPVLRLDRSEHSSGFPPVLLNSIPKSGTYLGEALLAQLGWRSTRLQLWSHNVIDDYRDIPDKDMHVGVEKFRVNCDCECLSSILSAGDLIVGHVDDRNDVAKFRSKGAVEIKLVRNLRDVLVSLYRFKLDKVEAHEIGEATWREIGTSDRFIAFLSYYDLKGDIGFLRQMAESLLVTTDLNLLRFEDIVQQTLPDHFLGWLETVEVGLAGNCASALRNVLDKMTPTFSGSRSNWQKFWDDRAERFFEKSGFKDLNARLGYE